MLLILEQMDLKFNYMLTFYSKKGNKASYSNRSKAIFLSKYHPAFKKIGCLIVTKKVNKIIKARNLR